MGKPIIWSGANAKLINSGDLVDRNNNSLTDGGKANYTWVAHGLTSADIGRPVRIVSANQLAFAQADSAANAEVAGFIYAILDVDNVRVSFGGNCPNPGGNVLDGGGNFGAGNVYFLSETTAGKLTAAEPTTIGTVSKPIAVGTSLSSFIFINYRGSTVGSTNARTQISLANNSTTNMQNCASYDAGSIEGWIYIDATTDYRFYFRAPFSKYGAGGNYYISPSYVGDTPPAGFTITINSSGQSIVTLPSITGFVSATCTYSLNAPAVGTNFPLALDSANLTNSGITGLTGTAATNAVTSGSAKIGEKITWVSAPSNFTPTTSFTDWTNNNIILTAGIWLVQANLCSAASVASGNAKVELQIVDSTNAVVSNQYKEISWGNTTATATTFSGVVPFSFTINTTGITLKVRAKVTLSGTSSINLYNQSTFYSDFFAIRIA